MRPIVSWPCNGLQKNVDEAVEKLKARGIEVLGMVCHVSDAQQRNNLIDKTVQVITMFSFHLRESRTMVDLFNLLRFGIFSSCNS